MQISRDFVFLECCRESDMELLGIVFCQVWAFSILVLWQFWADAVTRHFVVITSALWVGLISNVENTRAYFLCLYLAAVLRFAYSLLSYSEIAILEKCTLLGTYL